VNIAKAGIYLIVYMAIVVIFYVVISDPFEDIISGVEDINSTASDAKIEYHAGYIRTAFNMSFAVAGIVPIVWFIAWAYSREPDWGYYR